MNSDAPTFIPKGTTASSERIPEPQPGVQPATVSDPVPGPLPTIRVNLSDDPKEAGPSSPLTKEIGVGTTEVFPIRPIIRLNRSAATQTVESNHRPIKGTVYLIWDHSTVPYNTKRDREVRKLGMKYGPLEANYVCGLTDDDWNQKKNLKGTRQAIDEMYRACMDIPFILNDGAYTPYEQVITKASEIIDDHICFKVQPHIIVIIVSGDRRYVRYLNRRWQFKSITLGLITTDQSILNSATLLKTHVIT